jgi:hypothetical protein
MEDIIFPWSDLMAQLSWFKSLNNQFTKPLSPSLGVKTECGPRGVTMHQKVNLLILSIYGQKGQF